MLRHISKKCILAAFITALSIGVTASIVRAAFPVETWNVNISGRTTGVGYLTFVDDLVWGKVVHGYVVIKPMPFLKAANGPEEFHLGYFEVDGLWTFDGQGKVTGFFSGGSEEVPLDVSFTATGSLSPLPGVGKISINATGSDGVMKLKGVPSSSPSVPTTDLSGDWSAQVVKNGEKVTELFSLSLHGDQCARFVVLDPGPPVVLGCALVIPAPNLFDLDGTQPFGGGPGYDLAGRVVLSSGKKIGVALEELHIDKDTGEIDQPGDGIGRGVVGTFNTTLFKATMKGTDDNAENALIPTVSMTMTPQP